MIKQLIYRGEEEAIIAILRQIAYEANLEFDFVKSKVVIMDHHVQCNCNTPSMTGIRGVAVIQNQPYAAIRGYCPNCGEGYHKDEPFSSESNQESPNEKADYKYLFNSD